MRWDDLSTGWLVESAADDGSDGTLEVPEIPFGQVFYGDCNHRSAERRIEGEVQVEDASINY